jgi:hypothetical protein
MLAKFTEEEKLEGSIYACEKCNKGTFKCCLFFFFARYT